MFHHDELYHDIVDTAHPRTWWGNTPERRETTREDVEYILSNT